MFPLIPKTTNRGPLPRSGTQCLPIATQILSTTLSEEQLFRTDAVQIPIGLRDRLTD